MNLFELLPVYYRQLDAESGGQLEQFLQVMQEQYDIVEADIEQLYDNWFIETCEGWVAPYLGDLVGYKTAYETGQPTGTSARQSALQGSILVPRRDVANTIRYRRRKGSLSLLEDLSRDVAGWPAHAVEFGSLVSATAPVSFPFYRHAGTLDVRLGGELERLGSAFDKSRRGIDVRRVGTHRRAGTAGVGLFVSRISGYPLMRSQPYQREDAGDNCFTFSPLGNDAPLYSRAPDPAAPHPGPDELRLPGPVSRRAFEKREHAGEAERFVASEHFYGEGKSIALYVAGWNHQRALTLVPREKIIPAHLGHWRYRTPRGHVAVDPELGRFAFAIDETPDTAQVSFYTGFTAAMGGGQYPRKIDSDLPVIPVIATDGTQGALSRALAVWRGKKLPEAAIEFVDSGSYEEERVHIDLDAGQKLVIRAARGQRPVLRFLDSHQTWRGEGLNVAGMPGSRLKIDGLLVTGRGIHVRGDLAELTVVHSTLVPGWGLQPERHASHEAEPSVLLQDTGARVTLRHSITGGIQVRSSRLQHEPNRISVSDSIVDAIRHHAEALCSPGSIAMFAALRVERSTVIGTCCVHSLELAANSIFLGPVNVARRQTGCVRFCYLPCGSRTPQRYECQPDLAGAGLIGEELEEVRERIAPVFVSTHYGEPGYCRLDDSCPREIRTGADDESEMGAFHDNFTSQREKNLLMRLKDFVPAATEVGLIFTT